jgi:hypothetical protein
MKSYISKREKDILDSHLIYPSITKLEILRVKRHYGELTPYEEKDKRIGFIAKLKNKNLVKQVETYYKNRENEILHFPLLYPSITELEIFRD